MVKNSRRKKLLWTEVTVKKEVIRLSIGQVRKVWKSEKEKEYGV